MRLQNEIDTCLRINLANEAIHTVRERLHACTCLCAVCCVLCVWVSECAVCVWLRACVRVRVSLCAFDCVCVRARTRECKGMRAAAWLLSSSLTSLVDHQRFRPPARFEYSSTPSSAHPPDVSTLVPPLPPVRPPIHLPQSPSPPPRSSPLQQRGVLSAHARSIERSPGGRRCERGAQARADAERAVP